MIITSCYHPLKAFPTFISPDSGKQQYKVTDYDCQYVFFDGNSWKKHYDTALPGVGVSEFIEIPCGQCIGCRLQRSRDWANRCLLELQDHVHPGYFITLTYNDLHLPRRWYSGEYGLAYQSFSLCKRDFQLWLKRLRKNTGQDIRYFGCGEYGPSTMRPHGHFQVFGLVLDDLVELPGRSELGYRYFTSKTIEDSWSFPARDEFGNEMECPNDASDEVKELFRRAGHVAIGEITWETCAYTARYITKKFLGRESQYYDFFNIEPPFSMMSLKPGIGRRYYSQHPDLYDYEFINVSTDKGGRKFRPPRYFDRLFDIDDHVRMQEIKSIRKKMAEEAIRLKLEATDLSYLEMLQVEEDVLQSRIKSLQRNKV